jgi:hypothetical protein
MGFITRTLRKVMLATNNYVDPKTSILIELGDQNAFNELVNSQNIDKYRIKNIMYNYFKEYHTLDLKGDDIIPTDLSDYKPDLFKCDIITNIGTTEHVELEDGQFNCWMNMHSWLNVGGIMIHELPEVGSWPGHCRYHTSRKFFKAFEKYGYKIVELDDHLWSDQGNTLWCVMKKVKDVPFMDKDTFFSLMHFDINVPPAGFIESNNPKNL